MRAHQALRQTITQPAPGAGENFHILLFKANFFVQFAVQRFFRRLMVIDPALRELPSVLVYPTRPQHLADIIGQNDADIRAKTIGIDHGTQPRKRLNLRHAGIVPQRPRQQQRERGA